MEMDESWALEATVGYGSPQLQQVLAAKSLGLGGSLRHAASPSETVPDVDGEVGESLQIEVKRGRRRIKTGLRSSAAHPAAACR